MDDDEIEELDESAGHDAWCRADCDGTITLDGGFVTVACGCPCHDERFAFIYEDG